MIGSLAHMLDDYNNGEYDRTENVMCQKCGECCGSILPLSDAEIRRIKAYIKKYNVKPYRPMLPLNMPYFNAYCPFLDMGKCTDKCRIYIIRPLVCKAYKCDKKTDNPTAEQLLFRQSTRYPVDMWEMFFPEERK